MTMSHSSSALVHSTKFAVQECERHGEPLNYLRLSLSYPHISDIANQLIALARCPLSNCPQIRLSQQPVEQ